MEITKSHFGPEGYRDCYGNYVDEMFMEDASHPLYQNQKDLKCLPIPDLKQTCQKYLKTVEPHLTKEELSRTSNAVSTFLAPGGMGEKLQTRLLQRQRERPNSSWLIEWWNKWGYLEVRDPVVVNVSYFFHLADGPLPIHRNQAVRAAVLLRPLLQFRNSVASGQLQGSMVRGAPLDMTAFKYVFNACRIPQRGQDCYRIYEPALNHHVCVLRNNKFYTVGILDSAGKVLSETELARKFQDIIDSAGTVESPIGVLTSWDRDNWADARQQLLADGNKGALRAIESSICMVCLDNFPVMSREQMAKNLWHGDGRNRFYDKSIQLIVAENGAAGLLMEHSMADGYPATIYADHMLKSERANAASGQIPSVPTPGAAALPFKVEFHVTKSTLHSIDLAAQAFDDLTGKHDVRVLAFQGFGSDLIKDLKVSPDAFCQMAIQLAYYKMTGTTRPTYEATMMLPFRHGRTETTRSVSNESRRFCEAAHVADLTNSSERKELAAMLKAACAAHVKYTQEASAGNGIDRHLLGLRFLRQPGEAASLFDDPAYSKSSRWVISTSTLSNEFFDGWGWGEVVPDGIGVAYTLKRASLQFNVAARKDVDAHLMKPQSMCHLIEHSLLQMRLILETDLPAPRARL